MPVPNAAASLSSCSPGARASIGRITNPYIQKTGLALAGFHEYLQAGRVLIYGESEVRFLEGLTAGAAPQSAGAIVCDRGAVRADHRRTRGAARS